MRINRYSLTWHLVRGILQWIFELSEAHFRLTECRKKLKFWVLAGRSKRTILLQMCETSDG